MALQVTGTSGTINWCGQTWNLPADSGVWKEVCPSTYVKKQSTYNSFNFDYWTALHSWRNQAGGADLIMKRDYGILHSTGGGPYYGAAGRNVIFLRAGGDADLYYFQGYYPTRPWTPNTTSAVSTALGILTVGDRATFNDYTLTTKFTAGSHTVSGITYTWAKGTNW